MKFLALAAVTALLAVSIHDAAAQQRKPRTRQTPQRRLTVKMRAQQYWDKRAQRDLTGAYRFYCSSYKSRVPLSEYQRLTRLIRFQLTDVHVTQSTPVDNGAQITVEYRFVAPNVSPEPVRGEVKEVWVREASGTWCKPDEPVPVPFPASGSTASPGRGDTPR